ncbi:unnamed protein product [Closterium sp. Naga37s-1]|nr:unnamed protein product [Closterium sp. Naga37s-1]
MFPEPPPPIASTSPSRRLIFPIPSPHLPPHVTSTSPSRRLHFPLPSPPLPPPVASTSPSRRLHFPLPSPPLPPPFASTSPSRRLHFPLPSPPLPPPVASTSPSRRIHFPIPSQALPPPAPSTSPSRRLRFLLTLSPLSPFPLPTLPRRPSVGSKVASLLRHRDQSSFRRHPILPLAPPLSSPHFPPLPFPLRSAAYSHSLASPTSHRLSVSFSPFRPSVWAPPLQHSLLSRSRATAIAIKVESGPGSSCEGCSKLSLLPSPLSILPPPLSPSRPSSPPRRVAIWRHLRVFYAHVAMSEAPSPSTPHSCFLTRAPPHSLHAALFFPPNFFQSSLQAPTRTSHQVPVPRPLASPDPAAEPVPRPASEPEAHGKREGMTAGDGLTPTSPLLTPSSSPLSCIGACVLFCLWMLWAAEEELYGEKILSVDSLTSDFYSMLSSHLSILPSLRSLTLSPSTSSPFSVCCALTSSATPGSMRCGWWEA